MRGVMLFTIAFAFSLTGLQADAASKREVSLEICPLDTITFVDKWAGSEFSVRRVGKSNFGICEGRKHLLDEKGECPYGELVLQGQLKDDRDSESYTVWAIYRVLKASPCCGWLVYRDPEKVEAFTQPDFVWLEGKDVPRLRDLRFSSIDFDNYYSNPEASMIFGNSKTAGDDGMSTLL